MVVWLLVAKIIWWDLVKTRKFWIGWIYWFWNNNFMRKRRFFLNFFYSWWFLLMFQYLYEMWVFSIFNVYSFQVISFIDLMLLFWEKYIFQKYSFVYITWVGMVFDKIFRFFKGKYSLFRPFYHKNNRNYPLYEPTQSWFFVWSPWFKFFFITDNSVDEDFKNHPEYSIWHNFFYNYLVSSAVNLKYNLYFLWEFGYRINIFGNNKVSGDGRFFSSSDHFGSFYDKKNFNKKLFSRFFFFWNRNYRLFEFWKKFNYTLFFDLLLFFLINFYKKF